MYRILTIDGGGIRGIIPAKWLEKLEERIGRPLHSCFDLVAGTSTGSIVAAGIAAGVPASRLVSLYREHGRTIFPPRGFSNPRKVWQLPFLRPAYQEGPLGRVLMNHFSDVGAHPVYLRELKTDCLIVTYDVLNRKPRLLRSWCEPDGAIPVWEACKASCSAPTYFPAHVLKFDGVPCPLIDGGVVANNPSSIALAEAIRKQRKGDLGAFEASNDLIVISMGAGNLTRAIKTEEAKQWGTAQWALPILDVVYDGTSAADELVCEAILNDESYIRLQVDLRAASDDMDDASEENINELLADALRYVTDGDGKRNFERVVQIVGSGCRENKIQATSAAISNES